MRLRLRRNWATKQDGRRSKFEVNPTTCDVGRCVSPYQITMAGGQGQLRKQTQIERAVLDHSSLSVTGQRRMPFRMHNQPTIFVEGPFSFLYENSSIQNSNSRWGIDRPLALSDCPACGASENALAKAVKMSHSSQIF